MTDTPSGAIFSPCRTWRYVLWRRWSTEPMCAFVGLNPSTADETVNDPTIRRCIGFAKDWGCGGIYMLNLFAFRATDPTIMRRHPQPIGERNDFYIQSVATTAGIIVAAWGVHGKHLGRGEAVRQLLPNLQHLGLTKDGYPKHPLYLRADLKPVLWLPFTAEQTP